MYLRGETPLMFRQLCFIKLPLNKSIYTSHKAGLSYQKENGEKTRIHSSRMRTGRLLTVCWSLLPRGVSAPRGVWSGGICSGGRWSAPWGVYPSMHWGRHPSPLWTYRCLWKYYLGPTSLRPVITQLMSSPTWYLMIEHGYQNKFPSFPNWAIFTMIKVKQIRVILRRSQNSA